MPRQVIVQPSIEAVEIIDTPIPVPKEHEVVIKVAVAGTNPKDWKMPLCGDDLSGTIQSIGALVSEFRPGDRVAAFHCPGMPNGAFGEYAVAPDWTTFHIGHLSFEEGATVPVAALTAALALFADLGLPATWKVVSDQVKAKEEGKGPLLIYGVSSSVGAFAAKLARLSGIHPLIGVAGRSSAFAKTLVDHVVDYRDGEDAIIASIHSILSEEGLGNKVPYVFDAISEHGSLEAVARVIDPQGGVVVTVLPPQLFARDGNAFRWSEGVRAVNCVLPRVYGSHKDFGFVWSRYLGRLLQEGRLQAHPFEVVPGGLAGVLTALKRLRGGEASGETRNILLRSVYPRNLK
ncbi:GroES-like protein [Hyaloscypha variabilis F]|uniref:GroES-like protein n=1 Tax=Hyaloscypha variabilis (strain UAMH 11265 / GT02V1 / F) TaxID=1149755 RepID=A0A2J6RE46_HYAVF|nr:GroES-like protein [Hyaloscypha variabilis F]